MPFLALRNKWIAYNHFCKSVDVFSKIVGGANFTPYDDIDIGKENVIVAREKLRREKILMAGESIGGNLGRPIEIDCKTGIVTVKIMF